MRTEPAILTRARRQLAYGRAMAADPAPMPYPNGIGRGQTRVGSAVESIANIAVGFGIAMLVNHIVMPLFGHELALVDNFWITVIFTVVSFVRSYFLRRLFNGIKGLHR